MTESIDCPLLPDEIAELEAWVRTRRRTLKSFLLSDEEVRHERRIIGSIKCLIAQYEMRDKPNEMVLLERLFLHGRAFGKDLAAFEFWIDEYEKNGRPTPSREFIRSLRRFCGLKWQELSVALRENKAP